MCLLDHCCIVQVLPRLCVYGQCLEGKKTAFIMRRRVPGTTGCKARMQLANLVFNRKQVFNSEAPSLFKNQINPI